MKRIMLSMLVLVFPSLLLSSEIEKNLSSSEFAISSAAADGPDDLIILDEEDGDYDDGDDGDNEDFDNDSSEEEYKGGLSKN
ncbi:MAG: hypothetical protein NTZ52_02645 [Chlamydiae bacterium]|nr:hypothetical protein [Chlamydiota bacterium]